MSHLQPKFIAKAKAAHRNAKAPRSMPRSMIIDTAIYGSLSAQQRLASTEWWCDARPDFRIFSLKKGK